MVFETSWALSWPLKLRCNTIKMTKKKYSYQPDIVQEPPSTHRNTHCPGSTEKIKGEMILLLMRKCYIALGLLTIPLM
jgi:hypothetical protein